MHKITFLQVAILQVFIILQLSNHFAQADIPKCSFEDTANITAAKKFTNGSYSYEGLIVPPNLVGTYDYEIRKDGERVKVDKHLRGCICKLKACVKFCCHPKDALVPETRECRREFDEELSYSPYVNITAANGSVTLMHVLDEFAVQQGIPCEESYMLSPQEDPDSVWELFENGTLLRKFDMAYIVKHDYCLTPHKVNDTYYLNPINCPVMFEQPATEIINSAAMLASIPFHIATILVYLLIPKLRNLHGKCLICYLVSLSIGSSLISFHALVDVSTNTHITVCRVLGFTAYYFFIAAFFWLSVISFDLWNNFCGQSGMMQRYMRRKRFYIYSFYAWGLATLMTMLTIFAQFSNIPYELQSGIGDEFCWLKPVDWSAMIYFYGPMLLIIIFNTIMFTLTSLKIYKVKSDLKRIADSDLGKQKDNFWLFLRLFVVMGISWLLEIASYMAGTESSWTKIFMLSDICNATQGIIIFISFVMRRKVLLLIKQRIFSTDDEFHTGSTRRRRSTFRTLSTNVPSSPVALKHTSLPQKNNFNN